MDYKNVKKAIFNTADESMQYGLNELLSLGCKISIENNLAVGTALIQMETDYADLLEKMSIKKPIFIRHICPVMLEINITSKNEIISTVTDNINSIIENLDINESFCVQVCCYIKKSFIDSENDITNGMIAKSINGILLKRNFVEDMKNATNVISINYSSEKVYIGVSRAKDNISTHTAGQRRYRKDNENILSRAEFKLLEAIEVFNLDLKKYENALDLGAAPGGWTRVLLDHSLKVTAVDPAMLHQSLYKNGNVTHIKALAQEYLKKDVTFDIIVNDMRMDSKMSCKIMCEARDNLNDQGIAVMTLKLPSKGMQKITTASIKYLKEHFIVLNARQLFHNRNEVTLVLQKINN